MRTVIITGNQPRHKAFANRMDHLIHGDKFFIFEEKQEDEHKLFLTTKETRYFYKERDTEYFIKLGCGEINLYSVSKEIASFNPDFMFTFGCSILKPNVFAIPKFGCINIHTGLTQFFRGVDSCFWAIHDNVPQGIGATIHYVDSGIDSGKVIYQKRPVLSRKDDFSDLFMKSCLCGFYALEQCLPAIFSHMTIPINLPSGKLYMNKDFSMEKFDFAQKNLASVLGDYVEYDRFKDGFLYNGIY